MTDERKARRVIEFIQCLKHTKGEFHGKPFRLLPWQEKIIRDVFGTVRETIPPCGNIQRRISKYQKSKGNNWLWIRPFLRLLDGR